MTSPLRAADGGRSPLLAIDTATSRVVIALGGAPAGAADHRSGPPTAQESWPAGQRHGETLLPAIDRLLREGAERSADLAAIVVGTGPGTFTGLRVGLATAKAMAHGLGIPIVGVSTAAALLDNDSSPDRAVILPAGPQDRVARLLPAGTEPELPPGTILVAVDLDGRAPAAAVARGDIALANLGRALLRLGAARLAVTGGDDLARLVPEYVTLPRGIRRETGEVTWSHDRP
jgi:tRNA threonylcarbamoyl adenosine modification protein YeaZ